MHASHAELASRAVVGATDAWRIILSGTQLI